jgi:2-polyprenyl-3-methyl-5-hydroxy-6-metoxy-1,4-benzoquinol methylase
MQSLTRTEHWEAVHRSERAQVARPREVVKGHWPRRILKRLLGRRLVEYMSSYDEHQIWNVLCQRNMPLPGAEVVEIGSAPGEHLAKLSETFGLVPFGIEYSDAGAEVNRAVFAARGLDPGNVIHMDFFSDECLLRYRERFDVVVSRGFIEHFEDPSRVVDRHLELLKPGGLLIVTIPNLRGINHALTRLFHRELIPMHNLEIMSKVRFRRLFDTTKVRLLTCTYIGTFSFYLFSVKAGSRLAPLLRACMKVQAMLNVLFRLCLGDGGAENRFTSPQLIFAGVKR